MKKKILPFLSLLCEGACIALAFHPHARHFFYAGVSYEYGSYIDAFGMDTLSAICFILMILCAVSTILYMLPKGSRIAVGRAEAVGFPVATVVLFFITFAMNSFEVTVIQFIMAGLLVLAAVIKHIC